LFFITVFCYIFFNYPSPTEIYTLSLHDALPICQDGRGDNEIVCPDASPHDEEAAGAEHRLFIQLLGPHPKIRLLDEKVFIHLSIDRKSTRLNSSHVKISYAVFCLKKKKQQN